QSTVLALPATLLQMYGLRLRQMRGPCADHVTAFVLFAHLLLKMILHGIERVSRKKFTIRQFFQSIFITSYACKFFYITVPWRNVLITDRPIHRKPITCRAFKIEIAPSLRLPGPHQRFSTYLVASYPVEWLFLYIGML